MPKWDGLLEGGGLDQPGLNSHPHSVSPVAGTSLLWPVASPQCEDDDLCWGCHEEERKWSPSSTGESDAAPSQPLAHSFEQF